MNNKKEILRLKRHRRIKKRIYGTAEIPRLVVRRSLENISAQIIDDSIDVTLLSLSTQSKEIKSKLSAGGNIKAAESLGELFAKKIKEKGIGRVVFDRAGYLYHGRVKAFAESLRKGGLVF